MKKTLLLGLLAFAGLTANAQIANGTAAPDFTATDINGVEHNLYDYLNEGKTVILDISATWCGPCYNFHQTHALADLYNSYGPNGSDEVVVIFVEGDGQTTNDDLIGVGPNTLGDWTKESPYPIIDDASISQAYNLEHFPTVLRICPDGIMYEIGAMSAANLKANILTNCTDVTLNGIENNATVNANSLAFCEAPENMAVVTTIKNQGTNAITSATVTLKENGNSVATQTYSGSLAQYGTSPNITFDEVSFTEGAEYTVEISDINGAVPFNSELSTQDTNIRIASETPNNIQVNVYTGYYPTEMSWQIKDENGTIVAQAGPYQGNGSGGGVDANTVKTHYFTLPEGSSCYDVILKDSYGDGWTFGATSGIEIIAGGENGETVYELMAPGVFSTLTVKSAFQTNGTLGNETFESETFAVYPNPTTGILNFATQESVNVTVMDLTGKIVYTANNINNGDSIDLSSLQTGMYLAKINGENSERVERVIIK